LLFLLLLALVGLRAAAVVVVVVVARCFAAGAGVPRSLLLLLVLVLLVEVRGAAGGTETPCCASQARQPPLRSETYCSPRFGAQSEQLQKLRQAGHTNAFAETSNVNWGYRFSMQRSQNNLAHRSCVDSLIIVQRILGLRVLLLQ
jgi:hypothetical protein